MTYRKIGSVERRVRGVTGTNHHSSSETSRRQAPTPGIQDRHQIRRAGATAVMGGHIALLGSPLERACRTFRPATPAIGPSAPQLHRVGGGAPDARNRGSIVFSQLALLLGAKGPTPADRVLDAAFAKAVQGDDWKQDLAKNAWAEDLRSAAETRKHLDSEYGLIGSMLGELGLLKR